MCVFSDVGGLFTNVLRLDSAFQVSVEEEEEFVVESSDGTNDGVISPTLDSVDNDPLLLEPPPPPPPKEKLQEIDISPFIR